MEGSRENLEKMVRPACTDTCYSVLRVGTEEQVAIILECESLPYPSPYANIITTLSMTCCSRITVRNVRKHVCPNPQMIQQHLFKTTGFEGSIPQDGRVCPACYIQCPFDYQTDEVRSRFEIPN